MPLCRAPRTSGLRRTRHRQCDLPAEQPPELSAETLLKRIKMPLGWPEQWHTLGIRQEANGIPIGCCRPEHSERLMKLSRHFTT